MKQVIKHKLTRTMIGLTATLAACTLIAGNKYPVPVITLWVVYAVTLGFALVSVRKDLKDA